MRSLLASSIISVFSFSVLLLNLYLYFQFYSIFTFFVVFKHQSRIKIILRHPKLKRNRSNIHDIPSQKNTTYISIPTAGGMRIPCYTFRHKTLHCNAAFDRNLKKERKINNQSSAATCVTHFRRISCTGEGKCNQILFHPK